MADRKRKADSLDGPPPQLIAIGGEGKSGPIPENLVVRSDKLIYTPAEINGFAKKSRARCPTYGNCSICFNAGPVGKKCPCGPGTYMVVTTHQSDDERERQFILDAEKLAELLGKSHETAMVDRTFSWLRTPTMTMRRPHVVRLTLEKLRPQIKNEISELSKALFNL